MKTLVTRPTDATPEEVAAAGKVEKLYFTGQPTPAELIKRNGLTGDEVDDIVMRLDRPAQRPRVRLLLSRPHVLGSYLRQYTEFGKPHRSTAEGADFVVSRLAADDMLRKLADQMPAAIPAIPGSPCEAGTLRLGDLVIPPLTCGIDPTLIDAAADLADVTVVGDGMGVFDARTALVSRWSAGEFRFADTQVNTFLYCALRDDSNLADADRRRVQAGVFGPANAGFPPAFRRLLTALLTFGQDRCGCPADAAPSRVAADIAADEVRFNLDRAVTGVTELQIRSLRAELDRAMLILGHDEVRRQVAGDDPDGIWAVVRRLLDGPQPRDQVGLFVAAEARRDIFDWLRFEPGGGDPGEETAFAEAVEAALKLQAVEAAGNHHLPAAAH